MRSVLPLLLVLILSSTIATDAGAPPIGRAAPATSGSTAGVVQRQTGGAIGELSAREKSELSSIARLIAESPSSPAIKSRWQAYIRRNGSRQMDVKDVHALVQHVMRQSYTESNRDLRSRADKVRYLNEQKKQIRSEVAQQRQSLSANPGLGQAQPDVAGQATGSKLALQGPALQLPHKTKIVQQPTQETLGDDADLRTLELQDTLQRQQQLLQLMSNISKMLHDTAMAIIRNMK